MPNSLTKTADHFRNASQLIEHDLSDIELKELARLCKNGHLRWRWILHQNQRIFNVVLSIKDGRIESATSDSELDTSTIVRAVFDAQCRLRDKRKEAAARAAKTRAHRRLLQVNSIARQILNNSKIGPSTKCSLCSRRLNDKESIQRGVGSECWQGVLKAVEELRGLSV